MAATDGTQVNPGIGGDLIADEDLTGLPRQSSAVPQLGSANASYKLERTKIGVGDYGQDAGDAAPATAVHVRSLLERQLLEEDVVRLTEIKFRDFADSRGCSGTRQQTLDARGASYRGSTR